MTEKPLNLTNDRIFRKLTKHGFSFSSEKELNSLTNDDAKGVASYVRPSGITLNI